MPADRRLEHVIVVMLENRSFDHLLGFLPHPDPAFDGLGGGAWHNNDRQGRPVTATPDGEPFGLDPDHSHEAALRQLGPLGDVAHNGGFVWDYEERLAKLSRADREGWAAGARGADVMRCLDPLTRAPVMAALATEFALCQRWFSSVPGETWPNRNFAHAATSDSTVNIELGFYWDPTIFELIARRGATWRIYYDGTPQVWCFRRLWRTRTILDFLLRRPSRIGNWFESPQLLAHIAAGDLASYSFVEPAHNTYFSEPGRPRRTSSQHPGNNREDGRDFAAGERLVRDIYEALRARPDLFARTLLVITYDEHGGLFDHVPPGTGVPPGDPVYRGLTRWIGRMLRALADWRAYRARHGAFDFTRLGVRVPAVLVSPWIPPATLVTRPLEHASIPATLRALFAPDLPPLTNRDEHAATFHDLVTASPLAEPRPLPDLSGVGAPGPEEAAPAAVPAAGPPTPPAADEFDLQLAALTGRVQRHLRRTPPALVARARRPAAAAPLPVAEPMKLFATLTRSARDGRA